jgi:hypothetical protein
MIKEVVTIALHKDAGIRFQSTEEAAIFLSTPSSQSLQAAITPSTVAAELLGLLSAASARASASCGYQAIIAE